MDMEMMGTDIMNKMMNKFNMLFVCATKKITLPIALTPIVLLIFIDN